MHFGITLEQSRDWIRIY